MFDDKTLEKIFSNDKTQNVPIVYQATMIHVIEKVLEEKESDSSATVRKSLSISTTSVSVPDANIPTTDADNALTVDTESYNGYQW